MKKIKIASLAIFLAMCASHVFQPARLEAKQAEFKYKSLTYIEMDIERWNICWYATTECTNEEGKSCTLIGSKARGVRHCLHPF